MRELPLHVQSLVSLVHGGATLNITVDRRRERLSNIRDEQRRPESAIERKATRSTILTVTCKYHFGRPAYHLLPMLTVTCKYHFGKRAYHLQSTTNYDYYYEQ